MKKEIELKIKLTPKEFISFTKNLDFKKEITFGYFKEDFSNIKEGIFPRIKQIKGKNEEIIFTVKRKTKENNQFFEREEMEIKLKEGENIENLREIIKSLGFKKEIVFEKKRKNIVEKNIIISFDELPFGFFVEFEGSPKAINQYLEKYGLLDHPRITSAYLRLWDEYRKIHNISEESCIFKTHYTKDA